MSEGRAFMTRLYPPADPVEVTIVISRHLADLAQSARDPSEAFEAGLEIAGGVDSLAVRLGAIRMLHSDLRPAAINELLEQLDDLGVKWGHIFDTSPVSTIAPGK